MHGRRPKRLHICGGISHQCFQGNTFQAKCCRLSLLGCKVQHCGSPHAALGMTVSKIMPAIKTNTYRQSINKFLARHNLHACQTVEKIQLFTELGCITLDAEGEEAARAATSEGEHGDALALELLWLDGRQERGKTTIERGRVHVTATRCAAHRGGYALGIILLAESHERFLDALVSNGCLIWKVEELGRDFCVFGRVGGRNIVIEELFGCENGTGHVDRYSPSAHGLSGPASRRGSGRQDSQRLA